MLSIGMLIQFSLIFGENFDVSLSISVFFYEIYNLEITIVCLSSYSHFPNLFLYMFHPYIKIFLYVT